MRDERANARCSDCGVETARDDMFGAEPDLLCEKCADKVRERTAPKATGRLVSTLVSGRVPVTIAALGVAIVLFMLGQQRTFPLFSMTAPALHPGYMLLIGVEEPWRLLTCAFLHLGIFHILFNAWWIWDLGRAIEGRRGSLVYGFLFVGSAVCASAVQWIFSGPGVGLSGVVYALAGFLFAIRREDPVAGAIMNPYTSRLLVAWLVIGVVLTETGAFPIGNWAHGAGGVFGLVAGFGARGRLRWIVWPLLAVATAALVYAVTQGVRTW